MLAIVGGRNGVGGGRKATTNKKMTANATFHRTTGRTPGFLRAILSEQTYAASSPSKGTPDQPWMVKGVAVFGAIAGRARQPQPKR